MSPGSELPGNAAQIEYWNAAAGDNLGEASGTADPTAPGPFAFAEEGRLRTILAAAGLGQRPRDARIRGDRGRYRGNSCSAISFPQGKARLGAAAEVAVRRLRRIGLDSGQRKRAIRIGMSNEPSHSVDPFRVGNRRNAGIGAGSGRL